jgi:uncharacterized membrane protein YdbT with pleckstrin-like domain
MNNKHVVVRLFLIILVLAVLLWTTFLTERTVRITQNILRLLRKRKERETERIRVVTVRGAGGGIGFQQLPG